VPSAAYLPIDQEPVQLSDDRNNTLYYSLRRCVELLAEANPNILELLFSPQDCVQIVSKEMEQLVFARSIFVTCQCGDTHIGYAMSQIKKARGQNKWTLWQQWVVIGLSAAAIIPLQNWPEGWYLYVPY
jgi:predicted nucleotidyltransferase